jgi:two-component system, NtrC family, response regulator AtoC
MGIHADDTPISVGQPSSQTRANHYFVRGNSPAMRSLERTLAHIASTDIPILLVGESGTGKEIAALEIHHLSRRRDEPFVKCGCAGLSADALAARVQCGGNGFGNQEGSGASLFLDGIHHLDQASQARLLSLLPDGSGSALTGCSSVRVISSATRSLEEEMKAGRFREELYYRINGVYLRLPPLRDRKEDIPALLEFFFKKYASLFERPEPKVSEPTMNLLLRHSWPGNIRELENVARKIVALGNEELATHDLAAESAPNGAEPNGGGAKRSENGQAAPGAPRALKEAAREASRQAERVLILNQLERTRWNRKKTARDLQISYKALLYKLKQLGLDGPGRPDGQ